MTLNILSRLLFLASFLGGLVFLWTLLTRKKHEKLQQYTGLGFVIAAILGFLAASETWKILGLNTLAILIGGGIAYLIGTKRKIITENILLGTRFLMTIALLAALMIITMQPEMYMLGMAGNLTVPEKIFTILGLILMTYTLQKYTFQITYIMKWIKPRTKKSIANPYLLYAFSLFTLSLILFFFLTESLMALALLVIDGFLFAYLFTHYAPKKDRPFLNWTGELTFGLSFVILGLLLSNTFTLLIGALFLAYTSRNAPEELNWKNEWLAVKSRFELK